MVGVIFIFIFGRARHLEYLPYIVLGAGLTRAGVAFFLWLYFFRFFFPLLIICSLVLLPTSTDGKKSFSLRIQCAQEDTLFVPAILSIF